MGQVEPSYEFEVGGTRTVVRYTRAELEEVRRSNSVKYGRLFAADHEAYLMRRSIEGE